MNDQAIGRRTFLTAAAAAAVSGALDAAPAQAQQAVPNTTGTAPAKTKAPANAADCHMHIYDPRFAETNPRPGRNPKNATVSDYRMLQKRTGTTRVVVVTPRNYATDNRVTVDALAQLGGNGRGVAVVRPTVTDAELKSLNDAGIRGIRFSLGGPNAVVTWDMVEPLSARVNALGWHLQFNVDGDDIVAHADLLRRLPSQMVFDHLGHPKLPAGTDDPSHTVLRGLRRPRPHLDKTVRRLFQQQGRPAGLSRGDQDRPGFRQGCAAANGVGQRLAASERAERHLAGRRAAVRSPRRLGARRGRAQAHFGGQSGEPVRIRQDIVKHLTKRLGRCVGWVERQRNRRRMHSMHCR